MEELQIEANSLKMEEAEVRSQMTPANWKILGPVHERQLEKIKLRLEELERKGITPAVWQVSQHAYTYLTTE